MRNRRLSYLLILLFQLAATLATAQTQQGYVKTKGRLGPGGKVVAGQRLPGATIMLQGGSSTSSAAQGTFAVKAAGGKFTLQKVVKEGYDLVDAEALRSYRCSVNPLVLTMETRLQQRTDKSDAARLVRRQLNRKIGRQREEIERLREENRLTEEKYQEALGQLLDMEESSQSLVEKMAEEYSKIDYDLVDDFNREFNALFLAGELEKADSLLRTRGNILSDVAELNRLKQANEEVSRQLERSRAMQERKLSDLAERCYKQHELFLMQHQLDSAAYYISLRAQLDTTNTQWQLDAGRFARDYVANLPEALALFQKALSQATATDDADSEMAACKELGTVYLKLGDFANATQCLNKTLATAQRLYGDNHAAVAEAYVSLSELHYALNKYTEALRYQEQARDIFLALYGENHERVAITYSDIGAVNLALGNTQQALQLTEKALAIHTAIDNTENEKVAYTYNNLGSIYYYLDNDSLAKLYIRKALEMRLKIFGKETHPLVALSYGNLSGAYYASGQYDEALSCGEKALSIFKTLYGERHPEVAHRYDNIGCIYKKVGNRQKALDYLLHALSIFEEAYGQNSEFVVRACIIVAVIYMDMGDLSNASVYLNRAQTICNTNNIESSRVQESLKEAQERLEQETKQTMSKQEK